MQRFDVVVIGAGAAGLYCAGIAGQRGLKVLLLDHAEAVAEKVRISGGGRCNFTNLHTAPGAFLSDNPDFCRSALARHPPAEFIALLRRHGVAWHEKHKGQLFCDDGSARIIAVLLAECAAGGVERWQPCAVHAVRADAAGFQLDTDRGTVSAPQLVVASGGLSLPKIGASDFGHRLARQFGHRVVNPRPALVPLTFDPAAWAPWQRLAGVALPVVIAIDAPPSAPARRGAARRTAFEEDLLFTHRGLSGPAVLQISSFWQPGQALAIDLAAGADLAARLVDAKARHARQRLVNALAEVLPQRVAETWLALRGTDPTQPLADCRDRDLLALAQSLQRWSVRPSGTEGWRKAEVTAGGVDTRDLDSRTLGSRHQAGLYFIGEVVDVTGWLGGYNFQWAWASAYACAHNLLRP